MGSKEDGKSYHEYVTEAMSEFPVVLDIQNLEVIYDDFRTKVWSTLPPETEEDEKAFHNILHNQLEETIYKEFGVKLSDTYKAENNITNGTRLLLDKVIPLLEGSTSFVQYIVSDYLSKNDLPVNIDNIRSAVYDLYTIEWDIDVFIDMCSLIVKIDDDPEPPYLFLLEVPVSQELPIEVNQDFFDHMFGADEESAADVTYDAIRLSQDI